MTEVKLAVGYDEYEDGQRMNTEIERLSASPEAAQLTSLIIGDWGQAYENSSDEVVEALVKHSGSFPALRKLFIGDMSYEECEISWITQTDLSPCSLPTRSFNHSPYKAGPILASASCSMTSWRN